jgi:hypothetical protein
MNEEYTEAYFMLTKKEADHLMKFRIKEECNRLQNKVKEDIFRQVNKTKDGWKVKLIFYNCKRISLLEINTLSEMVKDEEGWELSYDIKNWKGHAEKFFSKLY